MKIAAAASYRAVPSILIVAPRGSTNLVDFSEIPALSTAHSMVIGRVAEELAVENAVNTACDMFLKNTIGFFRVKNQYKKNRVTKAWKPKPRRTVRI